MNDDLESDATFEVVIRLKARLRLPPIIIHMLLYIRRSKDRILKPFAWLTIRQLRSPCLLDHGQEDCQSLLLRVPH